MQFPNPSDLDELCEQYEGPCAEMRVEMQSKGNVETIQSRIEETQRIAREAVEKYKKTREARKQRAITVLIIILSVGAFVGLMSVNF